MGMRLYKNYKLHSSKLQIAILESTGELKTACTILGYF